MTPHDRALDTWKNIVLDTQDRKPEEIIEQAIYDALREFVEEMKRRENNAIQL
jgi:hypothetical protein